MVYYFSSTGNTRWAAQAISEAIGEPLIDIACTNGAARVCAPQNGERIGFCFPVHGWRPPVIVREFIRHLQLQGADGHYCWALCTAGDDIGETMDILASDLNHIGLRIHSQFSLQMPESYVGLPFMDVDPPEKEEAKIKNAAIMLRDYISIILRRQHGESHLHLSQWPRINSRLLGGAFIRWLISDRPFKVDSNRCTGCGRCARVCPVGNISLSEATPQWLHNGCCLTCFACYHHCPVKAIEYGHRTRNKGQYYFGKNVKH